MPLNIDFLQVLLHMLNFVILAGGLSLILYKPMADMIKKRRDHFASLEAQNKQASEENAQMKAEYEKKIAEVELEIAAMRADAEKEIADSAKLYMDNASEKANALITAAEKDAEARKKHILESAQTEIGELVLSAAQKLLSDTVTPERDSALYDEFIRLADSKISGKGKKKKNEENGNE